MYYGYGNILIMNKEEWIKKLKKEGIRVVDVFGCTMTVGAISEIIAYS